MSGYVNPVFRPDITDYPAPPQNRLASGFSAIWPMSNPVGTETTQGMQSATPTDQIAFMRPDGTPVMQSDMARAHQQVQQAMQTAPTMALGMMGTTAPGEGAFSLEKVQRRALAPPNEHIWTIKDPAGANAGTVDTTWNPETGNLHIEDFQSEGGPNTLGATAIRQLHSALLDQYPGVKTISGLRISGATYAHRNSGTGPGRYAIQSVDPQQSQ